MLSKIFLKKENDEVWACARADHAGNNGRHVTARRALLIAFHFPPLVGSSGLLRTLKFAHYLPDFGYEPIVLTVHPRAYEARDEALLSQVPEQLLVHRTFGLDTKRHLSWRGFYFDWMATPDRFISWLPAGILSGIRLIHNKNIDVIFSTYPIPSAHLIGLALSRMTRRPWVADFRDPMWDDYSQLSARQLKARQWIEALAVRYATRVIVTTEGMRELFIKRYPEKNSNQITAIENGFDERDFQDFPLSLCRSGTPIRMIHAGLLEPIDRDPLPFFHSIKYMLANGKVSPNDIIIELIAPGYEQEYSHALQKLNLNKVIRICPRVPYYEALKKMAEADILLLFQGPSCNDQIPAKAYEYLRIGRPILALTPRVSETARLILSARAGEVVPPDEPLVIAELLAQWVQRLRDGHVLPAATSEVAAGFSRRHQTALLAASFSRVLQEYQM